MTMKSSDSFVSWLHSPLVAVSTTLLLIVLTFCLNVWSETIDCDNAYNCTSSSLLLNVRYTGAYSWIYCNGYHSCAQAIEIGGTGLMGVLCRGSFSCYKATKISTRKNGNTWGGPIECMINIYHVYTYAQMTQAIKFDMYFFNLII